MEVSPYKFNQPGGDPKPDYVHVAECPDTYRGKYNVYDNPNEDLGELYAKEIKEIIENLHKNGRGLSALIAESLQSCGGQIIPPKGYFEKVLKAVHNAGGVFIADEVQVGFGRVGSHYWAFETQNIIPDIVTVAKPMGNGHPVGAVVTTKKIADSFASTGVCYFNTYGGNPVSCAIANAVMRVIDEEKLQENAYNVGQYLYKQCMELKYEFDYIGDIRGLGLFIGIEMVNDKKSREPATKIARWIVDRMKNVHKILVSSDGPNDNVIKLKPPMVFNCKNADEFLLGFRECLSTYKKQQEQQNSDIISNGTTYSNLPSSKILEKREYLIKSV